MILSGDSGGQNYFHFNTKTSKFFTMVTFVPRVNKTTGTLAQIKVEASVIVKRDGGRATIKNVLHKKVKIIKFIKFHYLSTHFYILCDEKENVHNFYHILKNDICLKKRLCNKTANGTSCFYYQKMDKP